MMDKHKSILLFGPPGSGKGLQGGLLHAIPGFYHCSMGDVFRGLDISSDLGRLFMRYSSAGKLVPTDLVIQIWKNHIQLSIENNKFSPENDLLILDGIPRTVEQADKIEEFVSVLKVFHLDCPNRDELIKRIKNRSKDSSRLDDLNESIIRHRMEVYDEETIPVLNHEIYQGKVIDINALQKPAMVLMDILQGLKEIIN